MRKAAQMDTGVEWNALPVGVNEFDYLGAVIAKYQTLMLPTPAATKPLPSNPPKKTKTNLP